MHGCYLVFFGCRGAKGVTNRVARLRLDTGPIVAMQIIQAEAPQARAASKSSVT
jgi:hypothetical protein